MSFFLAVAALLSATLSWGQPQPAPDVVPEAAPLKRLIRAQIEAEERLLGERPSDAAPAAYTGLPETISPELPEDDGFVLAQRIPGESLVADVEGLEQAGFTLADAFDDEEWARLPDHTIIRRELKTASNGALYTIWRYPRGTRLVHRIYLRPSRRLVELRLEEKLADDSADRSGAWAFGVYRPLGHGEELTLYRPRPDEELESVQLPLPSGFGRFRWTRLGYESCRSCHINMGPGWYQYSDQERAGPCGFVPFNRSLLSDWARRYERLHGYYPFAGVGD
ncbi:MAG: hypothetical protein ACHQ49_11125 [Elusimicrobiota bacterium]